MKRREKPRKILPKGMEFVVQNGHKGGAGIHKYSTFLPNGDCLLISGGNNLKQARYKALNEINRRGL